MGCIRCIIYLAILGIASFLLGRALPKGIFSPDAFPYKPFAWERDGAFYERLHIRKWQTLVPDMSKIFKKWMPPKTLKGLPDEGTLRLMLQETCVAESTHALLAIAGLACIPIWPGVGGAIAAALYFIGNLPYVFIQRYNRPRLAKLWEKIKKKQDNRSNST